MSSIAPITAFTNRSHSSAATLKLPQIAVEKFEQQLQALTSPYPFTDSVSLSTPVSVGMHVVNETSFSLNANAAGIAAAKNSGVTIA
jgi:hypothetical protein